MSSSHRNLSRSSWSLLWLVSISLAVLDLSAHSQTAPQTVTLVAGWNALWLETEPVYPAGDPLVGQPKAPDDVFTNPAIDIVATPRPLAGSAEFFAGEPGAISGDDGIGTFNREDWLQWKRTDPTGVSNLAAIFGNRPYLVHTTGTASITLTITGNVRFFRPKWTPDRYNLVGFGLEGTRSFSDFFGPSGTKHPVDRIFTLRPDGSWVKVVGAQSIESGKAYWIFASGASNYMGPMGVDFEHSSTGTLDFAGPADAVRVGTESMDLKELTFTNYGTGSATPSATAVSTDPGLTLFRITPAPNTLSYVRGNGFLAAFVPVATQQTIALTIGARRAWTDDNPRTNTYRIKAGNTGASFYLPITAIRSELQSTAISGGAPAGSMSGLWVGDVIANAASSIVVNGSPVQPTTATAPLRILMHSDASGVVRLLSQVTLMQTKTADPTVAGTPVLVVDPVKIPFFEGIKLRDGKRMGVRVESIAYDMPRSASAWSGADLVTFPTRPTALQEIYDLSRPMTGAIGQTVTTTLTLDPFHRSNPLRHVYHQDLTKGPKITRTVTLVFDPAGGIPDVLTATFTETIQGLIKDTLTVKGQVNLRRVSSVATLQGQ